MTETDLDRLLGATSRTFALGIRRLPPRLRRQVTVSYLVLRVSDYLEDNVEMAPREKAEALESWAESLESGRLDELTPRIPRAPVEDLPDRAAAEDHARIWSVLQDLDPAARDVVVRHTADSTRGMRRWVLRGPDFGTEADLDDYMHEVAGRVGYLLTDLFALHSPPVAAKREELLPLSREFGLGLQTVNVIRGLHEDPERGWIFIPESFGGAAFRHGGGWRADPAAANDMLGRLVRKARRHLDGALSYITSLPRRERRIRIFCEIPYFLAERTTALSARSPEVFEREVKVPRDEVRRMVAYSGLLAQSNAWVRWYGDRLRGGASGGA